MKVRDLVIGLPFGIMFAAASVVMLPFWIFSKIFGED